MLPNKTYRFIFVSLTLREGKVACPSVMFHQKWISPMTRALTNFVLFYIGAPQQAKRAVDSTEKKGNVHLVYNLLLSCLPTIFIQVPHWWLHYLKHTPSFEGAMCRSHNVFRYCVNFPFLSCALLRYFFSWSRHCLLTWQNDFKYICHVYSYKICKYINISSVVHL